MENLRNGPRRRHCEPSAGTWSRANCAAHHAERSLAIRTAARPARFDYEPSALLTELKVPLTLVAKLPTTPTIATTIRPSMTAYSTAVGPSSLTTNCSYSRDQIAHLLLLVLNDPRHTSPTRLKSHSAMVSKPMATVLLSRFLVAGAIRPSGSITRFIANLGHAASRSNSRAPTAPLFRSAICPMFHCVNLKGGRSLVKRLGSRSPPRSAFAGAPGGQLGLQEGRNAQR